MTTMRILNAIAAGLLSFLFFVQAPIVRSQTREEAALWESVKDSHSIADFQGYLDKYPKGTWAAEARRRIEDLRKESGQDLKIKGTAWRVPFHRGTKQWTMPFKFMADGTCVYADYRSCTWSQDRDSVTITLDKSSDHCPSIWNGKIDGDVLEVTVHQRSTFSCQASTYDTSLYRSR